jgi:uncharacterized protein YybS (DUF2232 family)
MNNNVRKITEGAMMIAIIGVLLFFNRQFAGVLTLYFVIILPIPLIIYGIKYSIRDLITVSASLLFLTLILSTGIGDIAYAILSILVAIVYARNFKLKKSKTIILIRTVIITAIGEVLILILFSSVLGIDIDVEIRTILDLVESMFPQTNVETIFGDGLLQLMYILFVVSTMVTGALEAVIIHFVTNLILKRLGFKYIPPTKLYDICLPKTLAYGMFVFIFSYRFVYDLIQIELVRNLLAVLVAISSIVLFSFGFIFVNVYFLFKFKKNITIILILLTIFLPTATFPALVILGFLYSATDMRKKLIEGGLNNEPKV